MKQIKGATNESEIASQIRQEELDHSFLGSLETVEMNQNVYTLEEALASFAVDSESVLFQVKLEKQGKKSN